MSTDVFADVAHLLFGEGGDELIAKMNPTQSDLATARRKKRERTEARVGLATNVIGLGAGAAATPPAFRAVSEKYREMKGLPAKEHKPSRLAGKFKPKSPRAALALAGGAAGLQVANLGGDVVANRVLARSAKSEPNVKGGAPTVIRETRKKTKETFGKGEIRNNASEAKASLTRAPMPRNSRRNVYTKKGGFRRLPDKVKTHNEVEKRDEPVEVVWDGEIAKADADKQQIFGWASVVEINGEPVVDLQGDRISPEEMEKAGYSYVMKSRKGGDMHLRDQWEPVQKSEMIESFIVTDDKRAAMGLPDSVPTGWWVGFQVRDPEVWAKVKSGERTGFSIHGHGKRSPL